MTAILEVAGLTAGYGASPVLHGLDFDVPAGGVATILGANGAGKTTTLRAISGLIRAAGEVRFAGERIDRLAAEDVARRGVAHVPDGRGTFVQLSVEENLRLGAYVRRDPAGIARDFERVFNLFPVLKERRRQQAGTLSGGEQQMLAISRALMLRPRLMLMDEPSFGLAPLIVREIFRIMRMVNREEGVAILLVEQNASLALDLASRAFLLETGRLVVGGSAADLKADDAVRRSYLGY